LHQQPPKLPLVVEAARVFWSTTQAQSALDARPNPRFTWGLAWKFLATGTLVWTALDRPAALRPVGLKMAIPGASLLGTRLLGTTLKTTISSPGTASPASATPAAAITLATWRSGVTWSIKLDPFAVLGWWNFLVGRRVGGQVRRVVAHGPKLQSRTFHGRFLAACAPQDFCGAHDRLGCRALSSLGRSGGRKRAPALCIAASATAA